MSTAPLDHRVAPLVTAADAEAALALVDAFRADDGRRALEVMEQAEPLGLVAALTWLAAKAMDVLSERDAEAILATLAGQVT